MLELADTANIVHQIDWLSVTFRGEWSPKIVLPIDGEWEEKDHGLLGYTRTAHHLLTGVKIYYRPGGGGDHQHMVLSGDAIRNVELYSDIRIETWAARWRGALRATCSRIDYAVTSEGVMTPNWLRAREAEGNVLARIGDAKWHASAAHGVETLYLGSSKGETRLRCYRKDIEMQSKDFTLEVNDDNPLTRVEMQWRGKMAERAFDILCTDKTRLAGMVLSQVRVVVEDTTASDTNKSRWATHPRWVALFGQPVGMEWPKAERGPDEMIKAQEWLQRCASRSLAVVAARLGQVKFYEWIAQLLYIGALGVSERQAQAIELEIGQRWCDVAAEFAAHADEIVR